MVIENTMVSKAGTTLPPQSHLAQRNRTAEAKVSPFYSIQYQSDVLTTSKYSQQPSVEATKHNNKRGVIYQCGQSNGFVEPDRHQLARLNLTHTEREREGERAYARTHICLTLKNFKRGSAERTTA